MITNINNIYGTYNKNGVGGLISGIDTDLVVEQMLARSKIRIDKEYQNKQKLSYKQEAYRDISSKMLDFQLKYLSYSSSSEKNILNPKFFESNEIKSSSDLVSVSGNIENIKNLKIDNIQSVATSASFSSEKNVANETIKSKAITGEGFEGFSNIDNYIVFNYNGVNKKIKMSETNTDIESTSNHIQNELNKAFGNDKVSFSFDSNSNEFNIKANGDTNTLAISEISYDLNKLTGLSAGNSNRLSLSKSLGSSDIKDLDIFDNYKININGKDFAFSKNKAIKDIINEINADKDAGVKISYSNISNNFSVLSTETGENSKIEISDVEGNLASALFGEKGTDYNVKEGTDSVLTYTLNGIQNTINRSSNVFNIDGINVSLEKNASTTSPITFEVKDNIDDTIKRITEFIDDYNKLIDLIYSKTNEKPNREMLPLTPDQENELNEKEIEKWTKEAKKGMLYNDNLLKNALYRMRNTISSRLGDGNLSLLNIGISTTRGDLSGKLSINTDKLKSNLQTNFEEVKNIFIGTDNEDGMAKKLLNILKDNVGISGTSGLLIREAGSENGLTTNTNNLSLKMKQSDNRLSNLRRFLEKEREQYYTKFTTLEKMMNKINYQSAMFSNMLNY